MNFIRLYLSLVCVIFASKEAFGIVDIKEFFPDVESDLTRVTWAHAVNSKELLTQEINDGNAMMLEVDLLMGHSIEQNEKDVENVGKVPILAHPPNLTSDLTFKYFLEKVIQLNQNNISRKGIKLDFKDEQVIEPVLSILKAASDKNELGFPVWLNADVIQGPLNSTKVPIDGHRFIHLIQKYAPTATLSVGWTTRFGKDDIKIAKAKNEDFEDLKTIKARGHGYTSEHVSKMINLLEEAKWKGPVTFPVRAGLLTASTSRTQLGRLTVQTESDDVSFTLWSPIDDPIAAKNVRNWIHQIGARNVYIDLPFDINNYESSTIFSNDEPRNGDGEKALKRTDPISSTYSSETVAFSSNHIIILSSMFVCHYNYFN